MCSCVHDGMKEYDDVDGGDRKIQKSSLESDIELSMRIIHSKWKQLQLTLVKRAAIQRAGMWVVALFGDIIHGLHCMEKYNVI